MATKIDDDQIQSDYEDRFNKTAGSLKSAEQDAYDNAFNDMTSGDNYAKDADASSENEAIDRLRDREDEGSWMTKMDSFADSKGFGKSSSRVNTFVKKGGPVGGIIGLLLGGAGLISFFGGPGLLIVNFVEQYTEKFNTQLASTDARMSRIVRAKLDNTTKGCTLPGSVLCKFSTFSQKELDNFEKNNLTAVGSKETITGRYKITGLKKQSGTVVDAKNFSKEMKSDIDFRNSVTKSYGGVGGVKLIGLWDKIANTYKGSRGINFSRPFKEGSTDADRLKVVDDLSKGNPQTSGTVANSCDGRTPECTPEQREQAQAEADEAARRADDIVKTSDIGTPDESASSKIGSGAGGLGTMFKGLGILGAADSACAFIGFSRNVGMVTKTTRLKQMLLFSTIFLTTASMIKAGDAVDQDVSFVGDMLTQTFTNDSGVTTKSATDSFGYRNAAYGDSGIDEAASPYIVGASFGGEASGVMQQAIALLGAGGEAAGSLLAIKETCKFVNNPFVVGGSLIVGIGALFLPGANAAKIGSQIAISGGFIAAQAILLAKLGDITKGVLVGKNDSREAVGNIMNVASSSMLMGIGNNGGNPILTQSQTKSVLAHYNETKLAYAQMDRLDRSPFDATSENTFVGSIYSKMMPYIAKSSSPGGMLSSIIGLNRNITSNLISPKASAEEATQTCEEQDPDIKDAGFATTEFCVPWTGTDPQYLETDPLKAADFLAEKGYLDSDTDEFTDKAKPFIESCIERDTTVNPYGYTGEDFSKEGGKNCLINDSNVAQFAPTGKVAVRLANTASGADDSGDGSDMTNISDDAKVAMYIHTQDRRAVEVLENGIPENPSSGQIMQQGGTATGVSGSDQELAKMIVANKKITADPRYMAQLQAYANGDFSCKINSNILKLIASLGEKHSLYISSLNRYCTGVITASGSRSLHYANGGGSAVDFSSIDGTKSSGNKPGDIAVYNEALAILPNKKLQLGQINCRPGGAVRIPTGNSSIEVEDSCDHVHIGVYP